MKHLKDITDSNRQFNTITFDIENMHREATDFIGQLKAITKSKANGINSRLEEIIATLNETLELKPTFSTTNFSAPHRGKPTIEWKSDDLISRKEIQDKALHNNIIKVGKDAQRLSQDVFNKHHTHRIYKSAGSMLTSRWSERATLIYSKPYKSEGSFIDQSARVGETLNYYFVSHFEYSVLHQNPDETYEERQTISEHLFDAENLTIPAFYTAEERVEHGIKVKTAKIKERKFDTKYAEIMSELTGTNEDEFKNLEQTLRKLTSTRERRRIALAKVDEFTKTLDEQGYSKEDIEEIIEEIYQKLEL